MPLRRHYRSLLLAICLCTLLLSPAAFAPRHARASSSPITVSSRTYIVHFPDYIDLSVSASDPSGMIVRASLDIVLSDNSPQELHNVPIGTVGHTISTTWRENTSGANFVPPGSHVSYSWQFWDSAGNTLTDTQQHFATTDTRFNPWQHLSQGLLEVNWYNRPLDFGRVMLAQASDRIKHISSVLGGGLIHPINLWIYETIADFHGSLEPGAYEWVGGVAFPMLDEASIVAVSTSDHTLVRDMPHELTHLIFHQLTGNRVDLPTWFDEGLAVYNQVYHESDMSLRFNKALQAQALLRLDDISSGFPADADQAYLAYAESWNLVDYMYSTFGQPKMAHLVKDLGDPYTGVNADFQQALGVDELHLENQWRLHLHQPWVISPDQLTPVPQAVTPVKQNATTDTSSWLLLGLGVLLVVGAMSTLVVLVLFSVRRSRAAAAQASTANPAGWQQQGNQAIAYPYPDPSTYMHASMYASPAPPSDVQNQEYPANPSRKQAPQE